MTTRLPGTGRQHQSAGGGRAKVLAALIASIALLVSACSGGESDAVPEEPETEVEAPEETPESDDDAADPPPKPEEQEDPEDVALGESVVLEGDEKLLAEGEENDTTVEATLLTIIDDATPVDDHAVPADGSKFIAAAFMLRNLNEVVYRGFSSSGVTLFDTSGEEHAAHTQQNVQEIPAFGGPLAIPTNAFATGNVLFEVPEETEAEAVELVVNGVSGQTGRWFLEGANPPQDIPTADLLEAEGFALDTLADLGEAIDLESAHDDPDLTVTASDVVDPAELSSAFTEPRAGMRFVAVKFEVANAGDAAYDVYPPTSASLVDRQGHHFGAITMETDIEGAGEGIANTANLSPGDETSGYIPFEIPEDSELALVHYVSHAGSGELGMWLAD